MSAKSHVFPYGITLKEDGVIDVFPAAEVCFPMEDGGRLSLFFLIDSGAHISAMPLSDAAVLGIDVAAGEPMFVSGIGGAPVRGWRHTLPLFLKEERIRIPMAFLDLDNSPRVLGRAGVFDRYAVVFEEDKRRTGLLGTGSPSMKRLTKALDSVS